MQLYRSGTVQTCKKSFPGFCCNWIRYHAYNPNISKRSFQRIFYSSSFGVIWGSFKGSVRWFEIILGPFRSFEVTRESGYLRLFGEWKVIRRVMSSLDSRGDLSSFLVIILGHLGSEGVKLKIQAFRNRWMTYHRRMVGAQKTSETSSSSSGFIFFL